VTALAIVTSIIVSLAANECCELSPWAARRLIRWSAFRRYDDPARAEARTEELYALLDDRPGKLFKLLTASGFVAEAMVFRARRFLLTPMPKRWARFLSGLLRAVWYWRYELTISIGLPGAAVAIGFTLGSTWLLAATATSTTITVCSLLWQPSRNRLIAMTWCVITPHRVRVGFEQAWVQSRRGKRPIVLYTTPAAFGERVLLWCSAGTGVSDLEAARDVLRAACWASDLRVMADERHQHIVALEVVRRP
jgi:hypothetical protein